MKTALAAALALPLTACAIIPHTPRVNGDAAAQGTPVALGEAVWTGDTIIKPLAVTEDSRCPVDVQCAWAGKLTVSTRITATSWAQTAPLTLGEPYEVLGRTYVLTSATPEKTAVGEIPATEYRFTFERR
ncbi:hypothetical protein [Qipengyuania sp. 902]|uniref:hypothetical protein n=1 Tax=Qipengyuania sp. 902 TaxID=3417565 RepID=UPI003EC008EF